MAHAGGGLRLGTGERLDYTNSREALHQNYGLGHRVFEVDFSWTRDGHLVALHDWEGSYVELFGGPPGARTLAGFLEAESRYGLTQLGLEGVMAWLEAHPDAVLVTDLKERNVEGLAVMAARYPGLMHRIIPQIYARSEHGPVLALGYPEVIFTLYRSRDGDDAVAAFAREHALFAVTMPVGRALGGLARALRELDVPVYAHTVNDPAMAADLARRGLIDGVYTDYLVPEPGGGE